MGKNVGEFGIIDFLIKRNSSFVFNFTILNEFL